MAEFQSLTSKTSGPNKTEKRRYGKNMVRALTITISVMILAGLPNPAISQQVVVCDDKAEWVPYTYYQRVNGRPDKSKLTGAVVELLDEVFKLTGMDYTIRMLPWKRCLAEVRNFSKTKMSEVFVNGAFTMERTENDYLSVPIYRTRQGVFYSEKKYPAGPGISRSSDINNFKICGVHGYDYSDLYTHYGLTKAKKIDTGAKDIHAVLTKIALDRCDILVNSIEPVYGAAAMGQFDIPRDIDMIPMPGIEPTTFHLFVSKDSPRACELLTKINQAILILQHNGVSKKIFKKYCLE